MCNIPPGCSASLWTKPCYRTLPEGPPPPGSAPLLLPHPFPSFLGCCFLLFLICFLLFIPGGRAPKVCRSPPITNGTSGSRRCSSSRPSVLPPPPAQPRRAPATRSTLQIVHYLLMDGSSKIHASDEYLTPTSASAARRGFASGIPSAAASPGLQNWVPGAPQSRCARAPGGSQGDTGLSEGKVPLCPLC